MEVRRCRVWITQWAVAVGAAGVLLAAGGGCRAQGPAGGPARGEGGPARGSQTAAGPQLSINLERRGFRCSQKKEGKLQKSHPNLDALLPVSDWMPRRITWFGNGPYNQRWVNEIFKWCKEPHKRSIRASINAPGRFEFASRRCESAVLKIVYLVDWEQWK